MKNAFIRHRNSPTFLLQRQKNEIPNCQKPKIFSNQHGRRQSKPEDVMDLVDQTSRQAPLPPRVLPIFENFKIKFTVDNNGKMNEFELLMKIY